jgi:catechol 2,3-dioxygenase-like lactoylglutathione lyase family enzyme
MIRHIAPQFFATDIPRTLAWYKEKLGFECRSTWPETQHAPPVYAIVVRDQQAIHFRCAAPPTANPDKYPDELLDAYLNVDNVDALYAEFAAKRC